MVCIIDDRQDVWNFAPNLITVKPYKYFTGTGDINDPFGNTESPENPDEKQAIDKQENASNKQENGDQELKAKENGTTKEVGEDGEKNDKSEQAEDGNLDNGDEEEKEGGKVNSEKAESEISEPQDLDNDSNGDYLLSLSFFFVNNATWRAQDRVCRTFTLFIVYPYAKITFFPSGTISL